MNAPSTQTVVVTQLTIPLLVASAGETVVFRTWKTMQRRQNGHAHVNAGCFVRLAEVPPQGSSSAATTVLDGRFVFGGVGQVLFAATKTTAWIKGRDISQQATLDGAWVNLAADLNAAGPSRAFGNQRYREGVMRSLFFKFFLCCQPGGVSALPPRLQSAAARPVRPISSGSEIYGPADPSEGPVSQPVMKLEALQQTSGEARYSLLIVQSINSTVY
jgi:hypothetical protein